MLPRQGEMDENTPFISKAVWLNLTEVQPIFWMDRNGHDN